MGVNMSKFDQNKRKYDEILKLGTLFFFLLELQHIWNI